MTQGMSLIKYCNILFIVGRNIVCSMKILTINCSHIIAINLHNCHINLPVTVLQQKTILFLNSHNNVYKLLEYISLVENLVPT